MSTVVEEGIEKAIEYNLTFDAVLGTAQEDVALPLNWDAEFVLLSALDTVEEGNSSRKTATTAIYYMDDLVTICSSLKGLQGLMWCLGSALYLEFYFRQTSSEPSQKDGSRQTVYP